MNRRQFLRAGLVGGAVLAAGGAWVVWRDVREADAGSPGRDRVAEIIAALAPVLLAGALPADSPARNAAVARTIAGVKDVIAAFPAAVQAEIADLFRLLDIRIARRLLTGIGAEWKTVETAQVIEFLERWRRSRIALLQGGYFALHDLVLGAWYADASSWGPLGYPGPPNVE
jgi:hypothetical protein